MCPYKGFTMIEQTTNALTNITNKPMLSFFITQGSFAAGLLTWLQVLTPILGFISVIFGVVVGYFSMRTAYLKWKDASKYKHK